MECEGISNEQNSINSELIYGNPANKVAPYISIVIPTYRRSDYLKKAVISAVNQSNVDESVYEIVIVNNDPESSVPEFMSEIDKDNIYIYRNQKNLGMCGNINRCMLLARGEYIAYLHDDDILLPNYLNEILSVIRRENNADAIIPARYVAYADTLGIYGKRGKQRQRIIDLFSDAVKMFGKTKEIVNVTVKDCVYSWNNCFHAPTCGVLFKKKSVLEYGYFDTNWPYAFDFIFYLGFSEKYKVYHLHKYLGIYRMTSSASNAAVVQLDFFKSFEFLRTEYMETFGFIRKYSDEMKYQSYRICSAEAKTRILQEYDVPYPNKLRFAWFRILRLWYYNVGNMNITRTLPDEWKRLL